MSNSPRRKAIKKRRYFRKHPERVLTRTALKMRFALMALNRATVNAYVSLRAFRDAMPVEDSGEERQP